MGMRSLVSNIVTEDYVVYAELGGVERRRILASYVMRNALVPQVTGLADLYRTAFEAACAAARASHPADALFGLWN